MERQKTDDQPGLRLVADDEEIHSRAQIGDAEIVLTSHRLVVATTARMMLDIPISGLRRIQFDIERTRPATLVIVPEEASDEPQVLPVPPAYYREVAEALALVGERLAETE